MSENFLCPECASGTKVVDSRGTNIGVRRRRACAAGHRFTTYETTTEVADDRKKIARKIADSLIRAKVLLGRLT